jgi:hypothetical protein
MLQFMHLCRSQEEHRRLELFRTRHPLMRHTLLPHHRKNLHLVECSLVSGLPWLLGRQWALARLLQTELSMLLWVPRSMKL